MIALDFPGKTDNEISHSRQSWPVVAVKLIPPRQRYNYERFYVADSDRRKEVDATIGESVDSYPSSVIMKSPP